MTKYEIDPNFYGHWSAREEVHAALRAAQLEKRLTVEKRNRYVDTTYLMLNMVKFIVMKW